MVSSWWCGDESPVGCFMSSRRLFLPFSLGSRAKKSGENEGPKNGRGCELQNT
jgi:hypothetical protein